MASIKFATCALVLLATRNILALAALASTNYDPKQVPLEGTVQVDGSTVPVTGSLQINSFDQGSSNGCCPGQPVALGTIKLSAPSNTPDGDLKLSLSFTAEYNNVVFGVNGALVTDVNVAGQDNTVAIGRRMLTLSGCKTLSFSLGPLDTTISGARIQLSKVDIVITADPLIGGVVSSLLCSLAEATTPEAEVLLLNQLLALLYVPL